MTFEETVGSLKAHEERLRGRTESSGHQLLLTEEEWNKREKEETKLLLTREEWQRRSNKTDGFSDQKYKGKDNTHWVRDKSGVRCFNCRAYGHYAAECKRPKRDRETSEEANILAIPDDEPALLMVKCEVKEEGVMLINEESVTPKLNLKIDEKKEESNLWYLDNGASNHMTGQRGKFSELDEGVTGKVKFGDNSVVHIKGKGSITLKCSNGENRVLREVYYIPALCSNILSLGQLSEEGHQVMLNGDCLWVRDKRG